MSCESLIQQLANPGVKGLVPYQPGKPVSELERELGLNDIVKLASNENPLGPGTKALAAIQNALPELARYPDGSGFDLKKALAEKTGLAVDQITLGNGSNEILELVARTFLSPESEVVFSQHSFAVYPLVTQAIGATARVVPAVNYGHDLQAMLDNVNSQTALVFIANPNNPTGTYLKVDELKSFLDALPDTVLCVLDEAYYEYVSVDDYPSSIDWLDNYPNLIITRTFSKAYGLAGLRIGYGLSSLEIADLLNRVRQPFNNNALALAAAEAALYDTNYLQQSIKLNNQGMQQLCQAFDDLNLSWIPSVANFVSVNVKCDGAELYQSLLREGVIVRPVSNYQMPEFVRVSIGTEAENQVFITALNKVLRHV